MPGKTAFAKPPKRQPGTGKGIWMSPDFDEPVEGMGVKLGRNELCHCGSSEKYKYCCLAKDEESEKAALDAAELRSENVVGSTATLFRHAIDRVGAYAKKR